MPFHGSCAIPFCSYKAVRSRSVLRFDRRYNRTNTYSQPRSINECNEDMQNFFHRYISNSSGDTECELVERRGTTFPLVSVSRATYALFRT